MGTKMSSTQENKQSHLLRATERESLNCQLIQLFSLFKFGLPPRYICTAYSRMFKTGLNLKRYGLGNQETFANNLDDTIFEKTRYRKTSKVIWVKLKDTYRLSRIPGENDKDIENLREELIILFRRHPKGITWNKIDKLYTKVFQNQENVLELQRNATTGVITQEQLLFCRQSNNEFDVSGEFAVTRCWTNIQKGYAMQHKRQTIKDQSRTTGQSSNTGKATKSRTNCAEKPPDKYNGITSKRKNKEEKMSRNREIRVCQPSLIQFKIRKAQIQLKGFKGTLLISKSRPSVETQSIWLGSRSREDKFWKSQQHDEEDILTRLYLQPFAGSQRYRKTTKKEIRY